MNTLHTATQMALLAAPDSDGGSGNVFWGKDFFLDNIFAVGGVIGAIVGVTMLARANRSQSGENIVTFGNVALAALTTVVFTAIVAVAPVLLAKILPG